jgi:copper chaperone CopZ
MITAHANGRAHHARSPSGPWDVMALRLVIDGMDCPHCADGIQRHLLATEGVLNARVCHETGRASVAFDPACLDVPSILSLIETLGDDRRRYRAEALFSIGVSVGDRADVPAPLIDRECQ